MEEVIALAGMAGFAVQRVVELTEPLIVFAAKKARLPAGKRMVMGLVSLGLGTILVWFLDLRLMIFIDPNVSSGADFVITALVVGAGTEGVNIATKYFEYAKRSRRPEGGSAGSLVASVVIEPAEAGVVVGGTASFTARVPGALVEQVQWAVLSPKGGQITPQGLYTAPPNPVRDHIVAVSVADPTICGRATVDVG